MYEPTTLRPPYYDLSGEPNFDQRVPNCQHRCRDSDDHFPSISSTLAHIRVHGTSSHNFAFVPNPLKTTGRTRDLVNA